MYMRRSLSIFLALLLILAAVAATHLRHRFSRFQRRHRGELTVLSISLQLREGDLIFHTSRSVQSQAIQLATHSTYSHCGMLLRQGGEWQVLEAVEPVRLTPLEQWVSRGRGSHFVVKRLRDADQVLTPATLRRLRRMGLQYQGRPYDLYFGWSDERIYCSELLWKIYQQTTGREIGKLQRLREFDLSHPAVQAKLRERYVKQIPLDEKVISPVQMLKSPELVTVATR